MIISFQPRNVINLCYFRMQERKLLKLFLGNKSIRRPNNNWKGCLFFNLSPSYYNFYSALIELPFYINLSQADILQKWINRKLESQRHLVIQSYGCTWYMANFTCNYPFFKHGCYHIVIVIAIKPNVSGIWQHQMQIPADSTIK